MNLSFLQQKTEVDLSSPQPILQCFEGIKVLHCGHALLKKLSAFIYIFWTIKDISKIPTDLNSA